MHPRDESEILIKKIFNINKIEDNNFLFDSSKKKSLVAIGIAASGYEKFWPIENYIKVIDYLIKSGFRKFLLLSGKNQNYLDEKLFSYNAQLDSFRDQLFVSDVVDLR